MPEIRIEVRGTNRIANKFRTAAANAPELTNEVLYDWAENVRRALKSTKYPPKRPGQKYIRTGRLASSWRVEKDNKKVDFVNLAQQKGNQYASFVVGDNQAWMHKGRWWKAREIIGREIPDLRKDLTNSIIKVFGE